MKKIILTVAALALTATSAFAFTNKPADVIGIRNTPHDISGRIGAGIGQQKCIFAHTPHNAYRNVPLWNRYDAGDQVLYNSPSLTRAGRTASFDKGSISAMCMSCHDGVQAMGNIKNAAQLNLTNVQGVNTQVGGAVANAPSNLGQLTNDHPIGFSYQDAYTEDTGTNANTARLHSTTDVALSFKTVIPPFYNLNGKTDQMECASCHAAHDNRNVPFLRMSNADSALCLACHVK
jgi:predicted CXXCH cytochrome family protein